jgi:hypothetical protein
MDMTQDMHTIAQMLTFGIEIEFLPNEEKDWREFENEFKSRFDNPNCEFRWKLKTDGSFSGQRYSGGELNSPVFRWIDYDKAYANIKEVCDYLVEYGCKTHKGAGFHVHIGGPARMKKHWNTKFFQNATRLFVKFEDILYRLATSGWSKHRGYGNGFTYCQPVSRNSQLKELMETSTSLNVYQNQNRYQGLNPHAFWAHNTMEFRLFNCTLNSFRMMAYTRICVHLIAKALDSSINNKVVKIVKETCPLGTMANASNTDKEEEIVRFLKELQISRKRIALLERGSKWQIAV